MAEYIPYELWLGTFEGENFVWKTLKEFNSFKDAYSYYKNYIESQLKRSDEDLIKEFGSARLDIELRQGGKRLNWVGIYARKVDKTEEE